ncbi:voltage-dependent calcium channel subunit alpha-2/delta-3-like [Clytia hemisphaerica]|uniref:VWFA domain-containing protein n=1 Tax=Clytia hemisphaerica TaxID=252671 RepID=A0A7M5X0S9_9CNID
MEKSLFVLLLLLTKTHWTLTNDDQSIYQGFFNYADNLFESTTKHQLLKSTIHKQLQEGILQEYEINVDEITKTFGNKIRDLLLSYLDDLNKIKYKVKSSIESHVYDYNIQPFNYFNDKQNNSARIEPTFSKDLKVNLNQSFAQVPTEIFKYDKKVLNDFTWLQNLDPVFLENFKNKPTLLWQYFSSENGASKTFPGINYESDMVDMYDPRRRIWYNQAIMSPKDVVIATDMSGSMTGTHLTIAKLVVSSLINTLQQDDYFNVISFNSDVDYLIPCLQNLSEATTSNKQAFKDIVDQLDQPTGMADFPNALQTAFEILNRGATEPLATSNCTKVMMIVSDGVTYDDRTEEVLARYNGDKNVVIFSFIVGFTTDMELMDVACANGGDYYRIQTVGNVLDGVLKYQKVLSKPIGESGTNYVTFTPLYLDGSGLGMMTTISTGVFANLNNESTSFDIDDGKSDTELIGVAGIDIVISLLEQHYPIQEMGVFGHAFVINNNGLFLMHPKFKDQFGYLTDPATVYLSEVEHTVKPEIGEMLERRMIDGEIGCIRAEADWLFPLSDNTQFVRLNNTYCYRPLPDTPFFAGVSIPDENLIKTKVDHKLLPDSVIKSGINWLKTAKVESRRHQIASWPFCTVDHENMKNQPASTHYYLTADDLYSYLSNLHDIADSECDYNRVMDLLQSGSTIGNFTDQFWSLESLDSHNVTDLFVMTTAGFTIHWSTDFNISRLILRDLYEDIRFTNTAAMRLNHQRNLVFTVETKTGRPPWRQKTKNVNTNLVAITRGIYSKEKHSLMSVIGLSINSLTLIDYMKLNFKSDCDPIQENTNCTFSFDCGDPENYQCLMVDMFGYVVISNQNHFLTGYFVGFVNGNLLQELTELEIFNKTVYKDTQAECSSDQEGDQSKSSSSELIKSMYSQAFNYVISFLSQLSAILYLLFTNLLFPPNELNVSAATASKRNISCIKERPIYTLNKLSIDTYGILESSANCKMYFHVKRILETNLIFIVTKNICTADETFPAKIVSNEPVPIFENRICEKSMHYRLPRSKCYRSNAKEKTCFFEYTNTDGNLFFYLILGYSGSCLFIAVVMVIMTYCRNLFY